MTRTPLGCESGRPAGTVDDPSDVEICPICEGRGMLVHGRFWEGCDCLDQAETQPGRDALGDVAELNTVKQDEGTDDV